MKISIEQIKKLREESEAPVMEVKKALEKSGGDLKKARDELKKWTLKKAAKKQGEITSQGLIEAYIHSGRVGALVKLSCQTDFVARNELFKNLAHDLAMQIASMNPKDIKTLLDQEYIRDPKKKIKDLINESIARLGENIEIKEIARFSI